MASVQHDSVKSDSLQIEGRLGEMIRNQMHHVQIYFMHLNAVFCHKPMRSIGFRVAISPTARIPHMEQLN